MFDDMTSQEIIDRLRSREADLRTRGVRHAALFGSAARDTAGPDSDIDIMIEIDLGTISDVYAYVGLKSFIAGLFGGPVDVVNRKALKPYLRSTVEADALHAF